MVSACSMIVTLSTRSQIPAVSIANSSTNPGLMPVPNMDEPPSSQAWTMRSRSGPRFLPVMKAAVLTTLTPASRMRTSSSTSCHMGL